MPLSPEQLRNAAIIVRVGQAVGASERDVLIGLMTAMQESNLKNINYGDRDSLGLFQQRPSMGWGSPSQVTNPVYAAKTFFKGKQGNPGLFSVKDRNNLPLTVAAQKVQRSAFPDAYAKHESVAREALKHLGASAGGGRVQVPARQQQQAQQEFTLSEQGMAGQEFSTPSRPLGIGSPGSDGSLSTAPMRVTAGGPNRNQAGLKWWDLPALEPQQFVERASRAQAPAPSGGSGMGARVVAKAQSYLGVPYVWGGNGYSGVDCSGLVQQVYKSMGINLPRLSADQARSGPRVGLGDLKAGDLVAWDNSSRNNGADHIAIYIGNGQILEAPRTGLNVRIRKLTSGDAGAWGVRMPGSGGGGGFTDFAAPVRGSTTRTSRTSQSARAAGGTVAQIVNKTMARAPSGPIGIGSSERTAQKKPAYNPDAFGLRGGYGPRR